MLMLRLFLRIAVIVVVVLALDLGVLFFGIGDPDEGWWPVSQALETQYLQPSAENQRALAAAEKEYRAKMAPRINIVRISVVAVTASGLFIVVREIKRWRTRGICNAPAMIVPNI